MDGHVTRLEMTQVSNERGRVTLILVYSSWASYHAGAFHDIGECSHIFNEKESHTQIIGRWNELFQNNILAILGWQCYT